MIEIEHSPDGDMIVVRASGTLTTKDYESAIPELEHAMELSNGPLRILMRLEDFRGWEIGALWRELEFDLKYRGDFGRIAVLGDSALEKWGTTLSAPFAKAEMRYFAIDRENEALEWLGFGASHGGKKPAISPDGGSGGTDPSPRNAMQKPRGSMYKSRVLSRGADGFIVLAAAVYGIVALAMAAISIGLIWVSMGRAYQALFESMEPEGVLLDAVSSLVISVAILDVAKYVMEEEVLRSRELRKPSEAREAVTKFMVIIALVVAIEGIVLVFDVGNTSPELLLFPIMLLVVSVVIVIGLGIFQKFSLQAEERLEPRIADEQALTGQS